MAADFASPRTAHFDATYGCTIGAPRSPSIDDTLMIEPPPAALSCLDDGLHAEERAGEVDVDDLLPLGHVELADLAERDDARVVDERGEPAERLDGDVDGGIPLLGVGDVEVDVARGVAELVGECLALVVEDVADDHFCALGDERLGVSGAHPPCPAADQCHFSIHASHDGSGYRTQIPN